MNVFGNRVWKEILRANLTCEYPVTLKRTSNNPHDSGNIRGYRCYMNEFVEHKEGGWAWFLNETIHFIRREIMMRKTLKTIYLFLCWVQEKKYIINIYLYILIKNISVLYVNDIVNFQRNSEKFYKNWNGQTHNLQTVTQCDSFLRTCVEAFVRVNEWVVWESWICFILELC